MKRAIAYILLALLCGILSAWETASADPLYLRPEDRKANLAPHLTYYLDSTRTLGVQDMRRKEIADRFASLEGKSPGFGYIPDAAWFRFSITHGGKGPRNVFIVLDNPLLDEVELFFPGGSPASMKLGDSMPFNERPVKNRHLIFPVTLAEGASEYFFRVQTTGTVAFQAAIWEPGYYYERDGTEQIMLWGYYGLMIGFLLFNLFLLVSLRDRSYLYYSVFMSVYVLFRLGYNGFAFQYLWPRSVWWNSNCYPLLVIITLICFVMFTRTFLRTERLSRLTDRLLLLLIAAFVLALPVQAFIGLRFAMIYILTLGLAGIIILLATGIMALLAKQREAFFYLLAWSFFIAGSALNMLKDLAALPVNFITIWSQQIGSAFTALFLTYGLADRINTMKKIVTDSHEELMATYASLDQERELVSITLRSIADAVITTDLAGNVILMNRSAEIITGWSMYDGVGRPCGDIFNVRSGSEGMSCPDLLDRVKTDGEKLDVEFDVTLVSRDGSKKSIAFSMAPIRDRESALLGTVIVFRDVTDRIRTEKEMLQSSKLKALGTFAGGLAHDFNNILTVIVGNLSLVKQMTSRDKAITDLLHDTEKITFRARDLTRQLLTFSRGGDPLKKITDIAKLLRDTSSFILSGSKIRIDFDIQEGLWNAEVDPGQISQVVDNIALNAMQAMPDGGTILVSAENVRSDSGNDIRIEIQDQGKGIPEEILSRIFDPFFTTRPDGTGLGLSIAHSIVKKHGGTIHVESDQGIGSVFTITLPALPGGFPDKEKARGSVIGGRGRVLVMDDEELVLKTACKMAQNMGYRADTAVNGSQVLDMHRAALEARMPYDVIIMDLTVPGGMGGREAIGKLREIDGMVRVIVSSGYSNDPVMANYRDFGFNDIIVKPYGLEEFSLVLNRAMGNKTS
ncbi:MAG: response regulator [Spirochaetes bacterium]|nr:response regulator [Spirochaetota bacterium]